MAFVLVLFVFFGGGAFSSQQKTLISIGAGEIPLFSEKLFYDISVFGFEKVAKAEFSLHKDGQGHFVVILNAWTEGIAAKISGHRRQTYQTLMEFGPEGRFRPLRFEQTMSKKEGAGVKVRVKRYDFDHDRKRVRYQRIKNGKAGNPAFISIGKDSQVVDFLTGFVNYRLGFYGYPQPGQPIVLATLARGGSSAIRIEAVSSAQVEKKGFFENCSRLSKVVLDPEVFDTGGGDVFVCLDDADRPLRGAVENVLGMGDVRGRLIPERDGK